MRSAIAELLVFSAAVTKEIVGVGFHDDTITNCTVTVCTALMLKIYQINKLVHHYSRIYSSCVLSTPVHAAVLVNDGVSLCSELGMPGGMRSNSFTSIVINPLQSTMDGRAWWRHAKYVIYTFFQSTSIDTSCDHNESMRRWMPTFRFHVMHSRLNIHEWPLWPVHHLYQFQISNLGVACNLSIGVDSSD